MVETKNTRTIKAIASILADGYVRWLSGGDSPLIPLDNTGPQSHVSENPALNSVKRLTERGSNV